MWQCEPQKKICINFLGCDQHLSNHVTMSTWNVKSQFLDMRIETLSLENLSMLKMLEIKYMFNHTSKVNCQHNEHLSLHS